MQSVTAPIVRQAMRSFCHDGKSISNAQLYEFIGLTQEPEKNRLRTRINEMVKAGEVIKIAPGEYEYNFHYRLRQNDSFPRLWRFVRSQKPGWSVNQACQLTRVSYTQAARFFGWLEDEGHIVRHGKEGTTILYRATDKAARTPQTPCPPISDKNPFERENAAAAHIARLMLCHDPRRPKVRREIVAACKILLERFEKPEPETQGEEE